MFRVSTIQATYEYEQKTAWVDGREGRLGTCVRTSVSRGFRQRTIVEGARADQICLCHRGRDNGHVVRERSGGEGSSICEVLHGGQLYDLPRVCRIYSSSS